jgi:hypothetical protein
MSKAHAASENAVLPKSAIESAVIPWSFLPRQVSSSLSGQANG